MQIREAAIYVLSQPRNVNITLQIVEAPPQRSDPEDAAILKRTLISTSKSPKVFYDTLKDEKVRR